MKILVVDDQQENRSILRTYLEDAGWDVTEASDGLEGLSVAAADRPDVIVSDILMQEMDGYEFLREVRRHELLADVPFIFYTGVYTTPKEAKLARDLGVTAFIVKPKEAEAFCQHIETVLKNIEPGKIKPNRELLEEDRFFFEKYNEVVTSQLKRQIKDLEEARAELDKQEINYLNLFNSIRDVIVIADLDRKIVDINQPALRTVFGYELEEVVGQKTEILYADYEKFSTMGKVFFDEHDTTIWRVVETFFRRKNGEVFPAELYPLKMTGADGSVVANIGMIRDISKKRKTESLLNNVFESMGEGMSVVDSDYKIITTNKSYRKMFGQPGVDMTEKRCFEVIHGLSRPCHHEGFVCPSKKAFETGNEEMVIREHFDGVGRKFYHENRAYPLMDESGQVTSVILVYNDVTERTQLEQQLRQAQKMEAIGTLTGGIAHDFNNILSVIVGHGTLMQMKIAPDHPQRNSIDNIMQAAERASSLTQRLLTFSRNQIIEVEPVILSDVVSSLRNLVRKMAPENIELEISLPDEAFIIEADRSQLEQVIMNLVINAGQAISGHGRVCLSVEKEDIGQDFIQDKGFGTPGSYAILRVEDNGCGMDKETMTKIYEPFFSTKETGQGTGLGLSVVYGIIKQHKGFITCDSTPNAGTTFTVYFPFTEKMVSLPSEDHGPLAFVEGNATILVAEDDDNVRLLLKELIADAGYEVILAVNGLDAVKTFTENRSRIDLVILDVIMPKLNGKEALVEIKKHNPEVKAFFISGYTDDILQGEGM
ncbi:MAG: hypothetical protein C0623_10970, partial [Desulfuromonas sp.]